MANAFINILKVADLRKRILFTLFILIVYRVGAHITVPGVNVHALKEFFAQQQSSGIVDFFDLFSGGALKRFTIFALGIMPYISASIILDLLKVVFPALEKLSKEGMEGYKKLNQYTKYGTIVLCVIQASAITGWMKTMRTASGGFVVPEGSGFTFALVAVIAITTGTMVLMWLGEIITERGVGNGISLIIYAGIIVRAPESFVATMKKIGDTGEPIVGIILIGIFLAVVAASILLTLGERRIPVQYGQKMVGAAAVQQNERYIPLKVNAANVIPIIFASALLVFPSQMMSMMGGTKSELLNKFQYWLSPGQIPYMVIYSLLIIFFTYFYTAIKFNTVEISDNLKKYGGFISGIRPGANTSEFLTRILNRVTFFGALFLAAIAIIPDFIMKIWPEQVSTGFAYLFGGTSLLIVVGVALDTLKQVESQLMMRHYDGFIKNKKMKGRY